VTTQLPTVIIECDEYETLTEEERAAFVQRLESALELGESLADGARRKGYPDFFQFVEDLEQDASHLQEFTLPWGGNLSRWLVHHSWTFHTTPADMRGCLTAQMLHLIDAGEPSTDAPLASTDQWLRELGEGVASAANAVLNATEYGSAMAHHIALDILLGRVLSACYRLRLNGLVPR
jgi:hypothetical protein